MNFFEQQAQARRRSAWLVLLFLLAVLGIVVAVDLVVLIAVRAGQRAPDGGPVPATPVLVWTSLAVLAVIGTASLYRIAVLAAGGGAAVARELGATLVPPDTADFEHRKLRNVVEEVAIASGVPVPQIYVLEQEPGINAFAAGFSPATAVVTVTRGALDKLSRDELQGVIAHEFSHIVNGDMRLNIRLMGMIFGILVLALIAQRVLIYGPRGGRDDKGASAVVMVAFAVLILGYIGVFFGRLIKASVSRSRELLADSSAVQFTRQTVGLAGALKKLYALEAGSKLQESHAEEVSHMLFGDGVGYSALFATHPPLVARIKRLEPDFDPRQIEALAPRWNAPDYRPEDEQRAAPPARVGRGEAIALAPAAALALTGSPQPAHYDAAAALHASLPEDLSAAARDANRAEALLLALALDPSAEVRERQLARLAQSYPEARVKEIAALWSALTRVDPAQRLPLASIALPSLRRRARPELARLIETLSALILADGRVAVFEYCLMRLLRMQLDEILRPAAAASGGNRTLAELAPAAGFALSVLAHFGQEADPAAASRAFAAGARHLALRPAPSYTPPGADWTAGFDAALTALDALRPTDKAALLQALTATVAADGTVTEAEAELLRVVCAALHCPLPPLLQE
jgi:Zn-dependent protease with chaperone function